MPPLPRHIDPKSSDDNRVLIRVTSILKWALSTFSLIVTASFVAFLNKGL
jgi:hypothetical protein